MNAITHTTSPASGAHAAPHSAPVSHHYRRLRLVGMVIVTTAMLFWFASWVPALRAPIEAVYGVLLGADATLDRAALLNMAIFGGVMAGWGMTIIGLSKPGLDVRGTGRVVLVGMIVWYVVDSAGSALTGVPRNILLNTAFFVLLAPVAWAMARSDAK